MINGCASLETVSVSIRFLEPTATSLSSRHLVCFIVSVAGRFLFLVEKGQSFVDQILSSQLRKAPSCSNLGGLREALTQQVCTAFSAPEYCPARDMR